MGPKVEAACDFARRSGQRAAIGALSDIARLVTGEAGTSITVDDTHEAGNKRDTGSG
jgi:carbamate kinase